MIKKSLRIGANSFIEPGDSNVSAHGMLRTIHRLLAPKSKISRQKIQVPLKAALAQVVAGEIHAKFDSPMFDESLRDGFAIASIEHDCAAGQVTFVLVGETGAGDNVENDIGKSQTWKVMTGGKVPGNAVRVIPQEWCSVHGDTITIDAHRLLGPSYIKGQASDYKKGDLLMDVGDVVSPASLVKIAEAGWSEVTVFTRPRVCFCCTGKELVSADVTPGCAQKISSNQYLLNALIEQYGCVGYDFGIVGDEPELVNDFFSSSLQGNFDLVITTGGTGGGVYDLVERGFVDAGGTLICNSVDMRPGKSLIVGEKGSTLYVGLPGPPCAVHTVFLEIVVPFLMEMLGIRDDRLICIQAISQEDIVVKTKGNLVVKEGVLLFENGYCLVRPVGKGESSTCNILIAPERNNINAGEVVEVHLRQFL